VCLRQGIVRGLTIVQFVPIICLSRLLRFAEFNAIIQCFIYDANLARTIVVIVDYSLAALSRLIDRFGCEWYFRLQVRLHLLHGSFRDGSSR